MEINGIPLHPLVVHAAVVFVPLAAVAAILMAVPKWRWLARWPALLLGLGAAVAVQLASSTGEDLLESSGLNTALIETHEEWAGRLQFAMWVLAGATVIGFWALPSISRMVGSRGRPGRVAALEKPLMVVLPLLAVAVLVLVVITGDAGARSVWAGN